VEGPFSSKPKSLFQQKAAAVEPPTLDEAATEAVEAKAEERWMQRVQAELGKLVAAGLSDARLAKDSEHQAAIEKLEEQVKTGMDALEVYREEAEEKYNKREAEWRTRLAEMRETEEGARRESRKRDAGMSEALR
jgi:hypothetical protein